jgi:propanediol dehydratase large subunit
VEERTELELGLRGLTTYAETVSVYGTEQVFVDGDDTPWSKAFLASCYASRGLKMRFTSGSGAECLMGGAEGRSMLYLEARCIAISRAAGAQGVQNGGIDGVSVTASVPDGMREVIAENLCVMLHDLESCAGNDTLMSFSDIRRTAHTLPLLLAGADFLFSGFGSIPAYDNAFGPSNFNAEDIDYYLVVRRDWGFEGALRARDDEVLLPLRRRAAEACRAVYAELGLAEFSDEDVEACVHAHGSLDVPLLPPALVPAAGEAIAERGLDGLDVVRALATTGYELEAERVLEMLRQRLLGDYLQTAAIFDEDVRVQSNLTDPNDYAGPGTGYRMASARRAEVARVRQERTQAELLADQVADAGCLELAELGPAGSRVRPDEVVVGLSPAFAIDVWRTLGGETVAEALRQILAGLEEEGVAARLVRVRRSVDVGMIGWTAARLSGSGVGIGLQGKGTAIIHRADLPVLANLELLPNAPLIDADLYRGVGRNAARYARGAALEPLLLPESSEPFGPRYHARVVALVAAERAACRPLDPVELEPRWR